MAIPFIKEKDDVSYYSGTGELLFFIPERYFSDTKTSIAVVNGAYVSTVGIFDWALMDDHGKMGPIRPFKFPTIFVCKPGRIEKMKNYSINDTTPRDYRVLHFKDGDEVVSNMNVPKLIDNVEATFRMSVMVENKLPQTIPYDKLHEYFPENMSLNAKGYGINMQMFGFMMTGLCRDPKDPSVEYRHSAAYREALKNHKPLTSYRQISVTDIPKFVSPYASLTSQNWDESLMAAIQMSEDGNDKVSPLERVVTG